VSDERHEEIAARLRAEAGARAPERLQADVMLRVRAEPRPRRIRQRRASSRPLGSLAAAACVLAALVFGLSHVNLSGGGEASGGGSSASAERAAAPLGVGAGGATAGGGVSSLPAPKGFHGATIPARQDQAAAQAQKLLEFRLVITEVPGPLRAAVLGRLALNSPLPKALGSFYLQRGRGAH
jgi:hypothetical protein